MARSLRGDTTTTTKSAKSKIDRPAKTHIASGFKGNGFSKSADNITKPASGAKGSGGKPSGLLTNGTSTGRNNTGGGRRPPAANPSVRGIKATRARGMGR